MYIFGIYLFILESLIELAKELSKDPKALSKLKMHRTTVSYKLQYGLANTFRLQLTERLRTTIYSLNLDEATSKNLMHVFTVLVSYYDRSAKKVKVEQLASLNVPAVDASALYAEVCALQKSFELPWQNLLAMLMDSASVMRGHKSGLETRIREEVAPHLG